MHKLSVEYLKAIEASDCCHTLQAPMSQLTSFRIGGAADILLEPESVEQLSAVLAACQKYQVPYMVMGKGSNLLVTDKGIRGAVICLGARFAKLELLDDTTMYASAGVSMSKLATFAQEHALSGLEFCYGIPGSVGGGLFMNAGAYGGEFKDVTLQVHHLDDRLAAGIFSREEAQMRYRHTVYHDNGYSITGGVFGLVKGDPTQISARMEELMRQRRSKQPLELPSAGSTFKRPEGAYAAALIEQCGLKGRTVGGAMVSTKHSGFIVNTGGATCQDVLELVDQICHEVQQKTGYLLELEPKIVGER